MAHIEPVTLSEDFPRHIQEALCGYRAAALSWDTSVAVWSLLYQLEEAGLLVGLSKARARQTVVAALQDTVAAIVREGS
jgi:hypothetical protein